MGNKVYICNIHPMHPSIKILRLHVSPCVATVQMQKELEREHSVSWGHWMPPVCVVIWECEWIYLQMMLSITHSYSIYYRSQIYIHTHTLQLCSKFPLTGKGKTHNNLCISQDLGLQRAGFFSSFQSAVRAVLLASMAERNTLAQGSEQGEHSDELSDTRTGSIPGRHYFLPSLGTLVFRTDSLLFK